MDAKLAWDLLVSLPVILGIAWQSGRLLGMLLGTQGGPPFTGDTSLFQSSATSACSAPPS